MGNAYDERKRVRHSDRTAPVKGRVESQKDEKSGTHRHSEGHGLDGAVRVPDAQTRLEDALGIVLKKEIAHMVTPSMPNLSTSHETKAS